MRKTEPPVFPACTEDVKTDVVVIGAGITGALTANALAEAGIPTVVVEKRHPAMGSTAASTALLQYEIDEPLHQLARMVGPERARESYLACYEALDIIARLNKRIRAKAGFETTDSLQYASYSKDQEMLAREYQARKEIGIEVELLGEQEIGRRFGFDAPAGLLSSKAAMVDPYLFAHALLAQKMETLNVYDCSEVQKIEHTRSGVSVLLERGCRIRARKAVVACGFEATRFLPRPVARMGTTYALATKPLPSEITYKMKTLLWETKQPYLYLRTTPENRLVAGGRDDDRSGRKTQTTRLSQKVKGLLADISKLFPELPLIVDYSWAGTFATTRDSLGYIGTLPGRPNIFYNLGYGGNGILYSLIGGQVIRDALQGKQNPYSETFSFQRQVQ